MVDLPSPSDYAGGPLIISDAHAALVELLTAMEEGNEPRALYALVRAYGAIGRPFPPRAGKATL